MKIIQWPNLWKFALTLGLVSIAIIFWARNTNTIPPATSEPNPESTLVETQPSATPASSQPLPEQSLLPTPGSPIQPPTLTPTPIPVYHVVQQGEIPLLIAEQYGISVDRLLEINGISDPTRLQIGQQLLIPITVTPTPALPSPTPTPTLEPIYYIVQAGDTMGAIARAYDTDVAAIMIANDLTDSQKLQIGQELVIPQDGVNFDTPIVVHGIESGDTFGRLAFLYGSTIEDILAANPGLEPTALQVGQKVIVPVTSPPVNPSANPRLPQVTSPEALSSTLVALQQQMINQTNAQRQANGLSPLQGDDELARIALAHAQDMVKRGYFAHITPEGVDLRTRFEQHGVEANWIGENIQLNTQPIDRTVSEAVEWFMNSPPHRTNMLHERFNHIGVGVAEEPPGWYTFVLVFAER